VSGSWGGDLVVNPIVFITNPSAGLIFSESLAIGVVIFTSVF
jgi:hypothetical protein